MKLSVLISILIFACTPILLIVIVSLAKNDRTNYVKFPKRVKIMFIIVFFMLSGLTAFGILQNIFSDPVWPIYFPFLCLLNILSLVAVIWSFTYRITLNEDHFIYRTLLGRNIVYRYDEITGIKWLRGSEIIVTFKICIRKKKIEVSNWMINFDLIKQKLVQEKVFKKFPRKIKK